MRARLSVVVGVVCSISLSIGCRADEAQGRSRIDESPAAATKAPLATNSDPSTSGDEEGGQVIDDGTGPRVLPFARGQRLQGSGGYPLASKPTNLGTPAPSRFLTPKEKVLAQASASPADTMIPISLQLADVPGNWPQQFRQTKSQADRDAFVQARLSALAPTRQALISWLAANGAKKIEPYWMANLIHAEMPAKLVASVAARAEVVDMSPSGVQAQPETQTWAGSKSTDAVRVTDYYANGITGHSGGKSRPRIVVAIIDTTWFYYQHPAFNHASPQTGSRILSVKDCSLIPCTTTTTSTTSDDHGTQMAAIAAGSVEAGQDPNLNTFTAIDRRNRSGHLKDSYLRLYRAPQTQDIARAIQQAVNDGADIINISLRAGECSDVDLSGINANMQAALSNGVIITASAGNTGDSQSCDMSYPGHRPETFATGALSTADDTVSYDATQMWTNASRGGVPFQVYGGNPFTWQHAAGVDAVAPGTFRLVPMPTPSGPSYGGTTASDGSSNSSAVTAALMGHIKNMYWNYDPTWVVNSRVYMAHALLYGNGWNSDSNIQTEVGMSSRSGAGKLKMQRMSGLVAPAAWNWRGVTIHQGETWTWPVGGAGIEPSQTTQWKFAALWTPANTSAVADVDFYVDDLCGGLGNSFKFDVGYDYRTRFRLSASQVANRCLQIRAYGYSVPPEGVYVAMVDYRHSGSTADH